MFTFSTGALQAPFFAVMAKVTLDQTRFALPSLSNASIQVCPWLLLPCITLPSEMFTPP